MGVPTDIFEEPMDTSVGSSSELINTCSGIPLHKVNLNLFYFGVRQSLEASFLRQTRNNL